jgi:NADH:ubiquinone reductase (H+-translocating)
MLGACRPPPPRPNPASWCSAAELAARPFCRSFPEGLAQITVTDRQNHYAFQPLLGQVATAGIAAPDIAQPIRGIRRDKRDRAVIWAEVTGIDFSAKQVTHERAELGYDDLVLAVGGRTSYFSHPEGVSRPAFSSPSSSPYA